MAALLLGIALLGAWFSTITHYDADTLAKNNSRRVTPSGDVTKDTSQFTFVGKVSGMVDCQFADTSTSTHAGAGVTLGRRYALKSGLMEIAYDTGAKVILQGPCEYTVESPSSGFLAVGKLVARVGEKGEGGRVKGERVESGEWRVERAANQKSEIRNQKSSALTLALSQRERGPNFTSSRLSTLNSRLFAVRTPTATVEDLGTEFGVEVLQSGETASHVFAGRVVMRTEGAGDGKVESGEWRVESGKQRPKTQDPRPKTEILLSAGQSGRVAPGSNEVRSTPDASGDTDRFVRAMPPPKAVQDSLDYEKLVLSLGPAVYYRMERSKDHRDGVIFDSAPGGHHGQLRLGDNYGGPPLMAGRFGSALMLRGPDARDYAFVPDYPKATEDKLTVSAWVYATGQPGWAQIAANWGMNVEGRKTWGQFHLALHQRDGDICARISQRDGEYAELREEELLPLGSWQHVALVIDGTTARLYRNGKEIKSCPCAGILPTPPLSALGIGSHLNENGTAAADDTAPGHQFWQGRIDELAIFNRALSAQQIEQLYLGREGKLPAESTSNKEAK